MPEGCFPVPSILCPCMLTGICSMPHSILHWYHRYFFVLKNVCIAVSSAQLVGEVCWLALKALLCRVCVGMMLTGRWAMRKDGGAAQKAALR